MSKRQTFFITGLRWVCVTPGALTGAILAQVAFYGGRWLLVRLHLMDPDGWFEPEIGSAIWGAFTAIAFVLAGCFVAPRARRITAVGVFALGTWIAYWLLWIWTFPESHPRAYELSRVPFWGTIAGGIVGVALVWGRGARQGRRAPGLATAPDPGVVP